MINKGAIAATALAAMLNAAVASEVPQAADPFSRCRDAAADAERNEALPPGLLLAIGKVESGRPDPMTGRLAPWPYSVNVAGQGRYFATAEAAIAHVQAAQAAGVQSIDVGCFQINLLHHPHAFGSLAEAFDPSRNGAYAAKFLASLHAGAGSWEVAAGHYHSMAAGLAGPYAAQVMAAWSGAPWAGNADPVGPAPWRVAAAIGVRVYGPSGLLPSALPAHPLGALRLPVVYVPGKR